MRRNVSNKEKQRHSGETEYKCENEDQYVLAFVVLLFQANSVPFASVLPLLLACGPDFLITALVQNITNCFDCVVGRVTFSQVGELR